MTVDASTQLRASAAPALRLPTLRVTLMVILPALAALLGGYFYLAGGR